MRVATLAAGAISIALGAAPAAGATWYVATAGTDSETCGASTSNPCKTIQHGIGRTDDGDVVIVAAGTYAECVVLIPGTGPGKVDLQANAFVSGGSAGLSVIDGAGICDTASGTPGPVVTVHDLSSITGFRIEHGGASGVRAFGAVSILSNIVTDNETTGVGGGIYLTTGSFLTDPEAKARIALNSITDNTAGSDGGGIYVDASGAGVASVVEIEANVIQSNVAGGNGLARGGGLAVITDTAADTDMSSVTISSNVFDANEVKNPTVGSGLSLGGGIFAATGAINGLGTESIVINTSNSIRNNISEGLGGGMSLLLKPENGGAHTLEVDGNSISANTGEFGGGGIHARTIARDLVAGESGLDIENNHVIGNHAPGDPADPLTVGGGGIYLDAASFRTADDVVSLTIARNEIRSNDTTVFGGGATLSLLANDDPFADGATQPTVTSLRFENNLIATNRAEDATGMTAVGGGVALFARAIGAEATVVAAQRFLTVAGNLADAGGGGVDWSAAAEPDSTAGVGTVALELSNSILIDNDGFALGGSVVPGGTIATVISYNDTIDNVGGDYAPALGAAPGTNGNVEVDPELDVLYVPPLCSPTIDLGDPQLSSTIEPLPNGGRVNLGHLGNSADAPRTMPDVNADGQVDGLDVLGVAVSFNSASPDPRYLAGADRDLNGLVDGADLAYVAAFFAQTCPAPATRTHR